MKLLTEIGSDDFAKLEIRSPKIKEPHKLWRHLNPSVGQESPPYKTLNQKNCEN
ncbi:hypothetical protein QUB68_14885 [Microcoleus sp. A006_D1]|uniref:hypothetical protein n=1 Tax=Microcoleus sp. A006_D1 TaxID=3055267 RepID=UPI002FD4F4B3